jgi:uncharacterized protein (TIGR03790 family)
MRTRPIAVLLPIVLAACGAKEKHGSGTGGSPDTTSTQSTAAQGGGLATGTSGSTTSSGTSGGPQVLFPRTGIGASEVAVLVNDDDPLSVSVAAYYVTARAIPAANVIHLHLPSSTANAMTQAEFQPLKTQVDMALANTGVQALAITWTKPYAVDNMSITSAFAMGYRAIANTCTDPNSQYASTNPYAMKPASTQPFTDLAFRPAMTIPATTMAEAKAIIDKGVSSDDTWPSGTAYLMDTSDQVRSARCILSPMYGYTNECQTFLDEWDTAGSEIGGSIVMADDVMGKTDVLFYVEGLSSVPNLMTNTYVPGAVADHLTSFGGQIPTSGQMSAFQFLLAGATGSYGTVVEPCAYQQKFPDPSVLIPRYFGGATLIEAYWKSVVWPAEGIFIGEPLARPFGSGFRSSFANGTLTIETTAMVPGHMYLIEAADSTSGPFTTVVPNLSVPKYTRSKVDVPNATRSVYRFRDAATQGG